MLRIFGLKDGLEFYVLDRENQGEYSDFCTNGPPGVCIFRVCRMLLSNEIMLHVALLARFTSRAPHIRAFPHRIGSAIWD